jgi:hypothetical protein
MPNESKEAPAISNAPNKTVRDQNFTYLYANSVISEGSAWDLRLTFAQFEELDGNPITRQKVAVVLPFGLAKLAMYWMQVAIISHEMETGQAINIRQNIRPPAPSKPSEDEIKADPSLLQYYERLAKMYNDFIASLGG